MTDFLTTQDLINEIETKNRRFRVAQGIFFFVLILGFITLILIQQRTLSTSQKTLDSVQEQLIQQKASVDDIKTSNKESLDRINRHLDCIVVYFGQPNRSQLTIEDINNCTLADNEGATQFFTGMTNSGQQSSVQQPSQSVSNTTPSQPSSLTINPVTHPSSPVSQPQPVNPPTANPQPAQVVNPVNLLGIRLCLPIVGVCVAK